MFAVRLPWPTRAQKQRAAEVLAGYSRTLAREERARYMVGFDAEGLHPHALVDVTAAPNEHAYVFCDVPGAEEHGDQLPDVCQLAVERAVVERQRRVETVVERLRDELGRNLMSLGVVGDLAADFSDSRVIRDVLEQLPEEVVQDIWIIDPDLNVNTNRPARLVRSTLDQLVNASCELYSALVAYVGEDS